MSAIDKLLKESIDQLIKAFQDEPSFVFNGFSKRAGLFIPLLRNHFIDWKKPRKCSFHNCEDQTIRRSHTISKSSFLQCVSENGHVCTPATDPASGKSTIMEMGINNASTFPGFCEKHERAFRAFEESGNLSSDHDIILQNYRTVCREVVVLDHQVRTYEGFLDAYIEHRNKRLLQKLRDDVFIKFLEIRKFEFIDLSYEGGDPIEFLLKEELKLLRKRRMQFRKKFYNRMPLVLNGSGGDLFGGMKIRVGEHLPVALAGRESFYVASKSLKSRQIDLIVNVIPNPSNTLISIFYPKKDEVAVQSYLNHFLSQDFGLINMVESWMIYGSDHWFLTPSVWRNIQPNYQSYFINELNDGNDRSEMEHPKTIFNKLKQANLSALKKGKNPEEYEMALLFEKAKFTN